MKNYLLKPLVAKVRRQDMSAFLVVFNEYKKLISFYGNKLGYEDAASELTLFFIELLYEIDLAKFPMNDKENLHVYIVTSIKNKYFALWAAKEKMCKLNNDFFEEIHGVTHRFEEKICITQGIDKLSRLQKTVFLYHFVYGFSIAEIAGMLNVSRQAVNKTKNKALTVLKEVILNGEEF